ncbi:hypothetical protein B0H17DRAFT_1124599 [Mycena rosella]|uniref:Uncharacterized protein n=1 Tax=Mycena rosella TaxID=1033263 RepID=A0AAD7MB18_MYCRO|nr:hypothetical protein B0H17DRAFT_1124599 [Mycena rosella]
MALNIAVQTEAGARAAEKKSLRNEIQHKLPIFWFLHDDQPAEEFEVACPTFPLFHPKNDKTLIKIVGLDDCETYGYHNGTDWKITSLPQELKAGTTTLRIFCYTYPNPHRSVTPERHSDLGSRSPALILGSLADAPSGPRKPWPLMYACDMAAGVERISDLRGTSTLAGIKFTTETAFQAVFVNKEYRSSTYSENLKIWEWGKGGALATATRAGRTEDGLWAKVRQHVCSKCSAKMNRQALTREDFKTGGLLEKLQIKDLKTILRTHLHARRLNGTLDSRSQVVSRILSKQICVNWDAVKEPSIIPVDEVDKVIRDLIIQPVAAVQEKPLKKKRKRTKRNANGDSSSLSDLPSEFENAPAAKPATPVLPEQSAILNQKPADLLSGNGEKREGVNGGKEGQEGGDGGHDTGNKGGNDADSGGPPILVTKDSVITLVISDERKGAHPHKPKTQTLIQTPELRLKVDEPGAGGGGGVVHIETRIILKEWRNGKWFRRLGENEMGKHSVYYAWMLLTLPIDLMYLYGDIYPPGQVGFFEPIGSTFVDDAKPGEGGFGAYLVKAHTDTSLRADWDADTNSWTILIHVVAEAGVNSDDMLVFIQNRDAVLHERAQARLMDNGRNLSSEGDVRPPKKIRTKLTPAKHDQRKVVKKEKHDHQAQACVDHLNTMFGADPVVLAIQLTPHNLKTKAMAMATIHQRARTLFHIMDTCRLTPDGYEIKAIHLHTFLDRSSDWVKQLCDVGRLLAQYSELPGVHQWLETQIKAGGQKGCKTHLEELGRVVEREAAAAKDALTKAIEDDVL